MTVVKSRILAHVFFAASLIFSTLVSEKPLIRRSFFVVVESRLCNVWQLMIRYTKSFLRKERLTPTVCMPFALSFEISEAPIPREISDCRRKGGWCNIPWFWISSISMIPFYSRLELMGKREATTLLTSSSSSPWIDAAVMIAGIPIETRKPPVISK